MEIETVRLRVRPMTIADLEAYVEMHDVTGRFLGRTLLKHWPQFDETELG